MCTGEEVKDQEKERERLSAREKYEKKMVQTLTSA